mmetsp:Transcript_11564/g.25430  ORF Transcript_11564/g.25430 Transcript_11564/m.25430 type:complete len:555 (+) Transcript_11564:208-1872(+)
MAAVSSQQKTGKEAEEVETALQALFAAYDLDESGDISRDEFFKIEMRFAFESDEIYKAVSGAARMTRMDKDSSGTIDYEEFRCRFMTNYAEMGMSRAETIEHLNKQTKMALLERARMGPRYHAGIRQVLRQIFYLFDTSGDGYLAPEEWVAAQKIVAMEVSDDFDEGWINEAAFSSADKDGNGVLDLAEFMESSFLMFEGVKKRADAILATLQRVVKVMEAQQSQTKKDTLPVEIWVQDQTPIFMPPHSSWQDEGTEDDPDRNMGKWRKEGEVALSMNLTTAEDVASFIRLLLKLPTDMWVSIFYCGPPRPDAGGLRTVTLLRGERPGEGNVQAMLQYLSKPNADLRLFVKNIRKRPSKLTRQQRLFTDQRDQILQKKTGQSWGLDWETQLVGEGMKLPPRPMVIKVGDALVIEVPQSDDHGEYKYASSIFMDRTDVLSQPVDEEPVVKAAKSKKKAVGEPDPLLQFSFVALKEGSCVLFVDLTWEDQEEKLALTKKIATPVAENSQARIGPIEVVVEKNGPGGKNEKDKAPALQWWNGEKWTTKKGPAKRKKR